MHPKAVEAIRREIRAALDGMQIDVGQRFPRFSISTMDRIQRYVDQALKDGTLKKHLRASELFELFFDALNGMVHTRSKELASSSSSFRERVGDDGIKEIEDSIIRVLESIPRAYVAYFWLPSGGHIHAPVGEIAPGIRIIDRNSAEDVPKALWKREEPRMRSLSDLLGPASTSSLATAFKREPDDEPSLYLAIEGQGYSKGRLSNPTNQFLVARMKHVIALGVTVQGFGADRLGNQFQEGSLSTLQVYDSGDDTAEQIVLPESMARYLGNISVLSEMWLSKLPNVALTMTAKDVEPTRQRLFKEHFSEVTNCIAADAKEVLTAAEWAFDASAERNETLSYLYTAIGLEAALGSDAKRVVESLSDRLSYLVGTTRSEREKIQNEFTKFYEHRSKIVHGRIAQLRGAESELLRWGNGMLYRAIRRELSLIDEVATAVANAP